MGGWINSSEIAHAVADTPEGPYRVLGTVLAPRGAGHWDATTCHNPHIRKIGGRYALFYMGNANGRTNTKRIGLALADSLEGPWQRPEAPLLEPGPDGAWDDHCTTNPSLIEHPNGEFWLYYKSWNTAEYEAGKPPVRGNRKYGLATARKLEGPYVRHPRNPLIDFSGRGENRQCEDAFVWREDGRFKIIVRDMGVFNHEVGLIMESADGIAWPEPKIAYQHASAYLDLPPAPKNLTRYGRFERPQLLLREGRPAYLFVTTQGGRYQTASGFVFKLA
jgi:beta-xylosidase